MNIILLSILLLAFLLLCFKRTGKLSPMHGFISFNAIILVASLGVFVGIPYWLIFIGAIIVILGYNLYYFISVENKQLDDQFRKKIKRCILIFIPLVTIMLGGYYFLLVRTDWQIFSNYQPDIFNLISTTNPLIQFYQQLFLVTGSATILHEVIAPFYLIIISLCYSEILMKQKSNIKTYTTYATILFLLVLTRSSMLTTFYLNIWLPESLLIFAVIPISTFFYKNDRKLFYLFIIISFFLSKYSSVVMIIPVFLDILSNRKITKTQMILIGGLFLATIVSYVIIPIDYYTEFMKSVTIDNPSGQYDSVFLRVTILTSPMVFFYFLKVFKDNRSILYSPVLFTFVILTIPRLINRWNDVIFNVFGRYYLFISLIFLLGTCFIALDTLINWSRTKTTREKYMIVGITCYAIYQFSYIYR